MTEQVEQTGTALTRRDDLTPDLWKALCSQARAYAGSKLLPSDVATPERAITIIMAGRELGLPPLYSLRNIIMVKGKIGMQAEAMHALILRDLGPEALDVTEVANDHCTVTCMRAEWKQPKTLTWTLKDAETAQLLKNDNWQKYPRAMLRSRAVSEAAKRWFPDVLAGVYTPDELDIAVAIDAATSRPESGPAQVPSASGLSDDVIEAELADPLPDLDAADSGVPEPVTAPVPPADAASRTPKRESGPSAENPNPAGGNGNGTEVEPAEPPTPGQLKAVAALAKDLGEAVDTSTLDVNSAGRLIAQLQQRKSERAKTGPPGSNGQAATEPSSDDAPALPKQVETIRKLQGLLGLPQVTGEGMTRKSAVELIGSLTQQYNERAKKAKTAGATAP